MNSAKQQEDTVLYEAMSLTDPAYRKQFLDQACAENAALRAIIEKKLAARGEVEGFFAKARLALCLPLEELQISSVDDSEAKLDERIGTQIGSYKLLQEIGEGGCGTVYLAEQEQPVRRRVALKVIKLGMDTKAVVARFAAERQALALMDHPNIARVLEAGATEAGRPYFVMELVRGVRITDYCDQNHLDTPQRLRLFIQVCHAIQHAHQKGVIHRDIKPSNVIVTSFDGVPMPKVIDFGIAKAIEGRLTEQTLFTGCEQMVGTPAYMSPEQAEMSALDVDTRSDIYSLGVLLYELLTGRTPFDGKILVMSGVERMRSTLREKEPLRPSMILTTLHGTELRATAERRQAEPPKLISLIQGDLDWIIMKALEKDRTRRYETANGLLRDVERHLNHEPVTASPPSQFYRLHKLVRRNKAVFISGALAGLALLAGLGASTWLFLREREARHEESRLLAQAELARQRETGLRQQAEDRETITEAAIYVSQKKFEEADRLLDGVKNVPTRPSLDGVTAYREVAEWLAVQGRWEKACNQYSALIHIDEMERWEIVSWDYQACGTAMAESGDLGKYGSFCGAAVAHFQSTTNAQEAWRILRMSLLMPADKDLLAALEPLEKVAENALDEFPKLDVPRAWGMLSIALWKYRQGDYPAAVQWCRRAPVAIERTGALDASLCMIRAMSYFRQGRPQEGQAELERGRPVIENTFAKGLVRNDSHQGYWWDWVYARILMREAAALADEHSMVAKPAENLDSPL